MNTITTVDRIEYARGSVPSNPDIKSRRLSIETESDNSYQGIQDVTSTHAPIESGVVADDAFARIRNISDVVIQVGGDASTVFVPWFSIPPGEEATMPRVESLADTYLRSASPAKALVTLYEIVEPTP